IDLAVDPSTLRIPETTTVPVHSLTPGFEFARERLQYLVWSNNYDARGGEPIWWHGRKAVRQFEGSAISGGGPGDVVLGDGTPLLVDGGPFAPPAQVDGIGVLHRWNLEAASSIPVGDAPPGSDLAPDQRAAVAHVVGGARVIAPAGSGKTRVLTERIRHLVTDCGVHPSLVTALAFNTKAAEEMRQRCGDLRHPDGPNIRTLNSLGLWICSRHGTGGSLRTIEEHAVRELIERLFEIRRQANTDTVLPYLDALSAIRLGLVSPSDAEAAFPDARGLAAGFDRYRGALSDAGVMDFDEQIYRAIEILLADPEAREAARARCRLLLVDEFQDLNPAHMLLIRLLSAPTYHCFGVGDDDQVIYGYAGATPRFLIDFPQYFPGAGSHALEVNYRCPPAVVAGARHLLSYNRGRLSKEIRPDARRDDTPPELAPPLAGSGALQVMTTPSGALAERATEILRAWSDAGVAWGQVAVLARVNSALLPVQVACAEAGIPSSTPLDPRVLGRTGVRTALAYLRIGLSPDRIAAADIDQTIRRPSRGIARNVAEMLTKGGTSSVADIRRLAGRLSGRDVPKLHSYADDLETVSAACAVSSLVALRAVREEIDLGGTIDVLDASRREADRSTHTDDLLALEAVAALHPETATFEDWLRDVLGRSSPGGEAVLLSTIHKMKGREWDHVLVFGATDGLLPHRLSDDEEGERRVFHVAVTRARRQAVVLADAEAPSRFLAELDGSAPRTAPASPKVGQRRARPRAGRTPAGVEPVVAAATGLVVEHGGHRGPIVEVAEAHAVMEVGPARVRVAYGSDVVVDGRTLRLAPPRAGSAGPAAAGEAEAALRAWRTETARRDRVPPYVILNDAELAGIAARSPATIAELAGCRGMGPIRIERHGDEILTVIASVGAPAPT
ncbi:MAG TPA: ATP-dependent DNA helicase UvrD2, partial [Acidimicrobiales bacterium]|nr:ATP-dependent DNA helicase UvrD2 [Acidimicrobiales bacterium]